MGISLCKFLHTVLDSYFVLNNCLAIFFFITISGMHQRRVRGTVCDIHRVKSASAE